MLLVLLVREVLVLVLVAVRASSRSWLIDAGMDHAKKSHIPFPKRKTPAPAARAARLSH